jgi:hypothetical protein
MRRYNERVSGNPVGLLVGFPFLATTLSFRHPFIPAIKKTIARDRF